MKCPACGALGAYVSLQIVECCNRFCDRFDLLCANRGADWAEGTINGDCAREVQRTAFSKTADDMTDD